VTNRATEQMARRFLVNTCQRLPALGILVLIFAAAPASWADPARALVEEGVRHENAEGVPRNLERAHGLYCRAAGQGNADALLRLGWMYANGRGVPRDDAMANGLFARAASLGNDTGARLMQMIRPAPGQFPAEPECLRVADSGPTPTVENPASFAPAPASASHRKLVDAVVAQARQYRVDPRLVFAVMRAESNFDPQARSHRNAQGLMQLIPETAERFAVTDAFDPVQNVRGGVRYLRWLLSYFRGDVVLALAAYNAGEGAVDRFGGVPPYAETMAYVARIRALYPHDRHPYDPRVVEASPVVAAVRAAAAARDDELPRVAGEVRKFLQPSEARLAQSGP
jgi:hypothetical protein